MSTAFLRWESQCAVLPSCKLSTWLSRWEVDGGFVSEFGDVTGPWRKSALRADNDAVFAWREAHDVPLDFHAPASPTPEGTPKP
jgi:hypothetical protein